MRALAFVLCSASLSPACSVLASVDVGYQQPIEAAQAPGHRGVTVEAHFGMGEGDAPVGAEASIRTKFGSELQQFAVAPGAFVFTPPDVVGAFARVGFNLLQAESFDGRFGFGMGSPWIEGGAYFLPDAIGAHQDIYEGGFMIFVKGAVGYDIRFQSDLPNTGTWSLLAGIGIIGMSGL